MIIYMNSTTATTTAPTTCTDPTCSPDFLCEPCCVAALQADGRWDAEQHFFQGTTRLSGEGVITDRERPRGNGTGRGGSSRRSAPRPATEKQMAFIAKLAAKVGIPMDNITGLNTAEASELIDGLLAAEKNVEANAAADAPQVARWTKHDGEWVLAIGWAVVEGDTVTVRRSSGEERTAVVGTRVADGKYREAASVVEVGTTAPATGQVEVVIGGAYWSTNGEVVYVSKGTSGHLYGKVWDGESFNYRRGILREIDRALTVEEAAEFGHTTTRCCCCGRTLKNPESVSLGIGPICRKRFWG